MSTATLTIFRADSFLSRLGGLLVRPALRADEALYLAPCASIHTFFMRYAIDVAFVDREGRVLKLVPRIKPFRAASCWGAHGAVEFAAGEANRHGIQEGSLLAVGHGHDHGAGAGA
jgi:uncharacterized membrane protein (UPF0127 family)